MIRGMVNEYGFLFGPAYAARAALRTAYWPVKRFQYCLKGVVLGTGTSILNSPIGKFTVIGRNVTLTDSLVSEKVTINDYSSVFNSQIGPMSAIRINVYMELSHASEHSVLGNNSYARGSEIGAFTNIGSNTKIEFGKIGKYCPISYDCAIGANQHPIRTLACMEYVAAWNKHIYEEWLRSHARQVIIGNDVWIGCHVVVMPGVKIGDGAVLGAGAIVTKDVPPYAIVTGIPAKVVDYRFSAEMIDELLRIAWWDWDRRKIEANAHLFHQPLTHETIEHLRNCD